ncbi:MAG: hypothetical protein QMC93_00070 [Patescibacteria group bacterium]|nr:hypothetical protein [Patescibacteria group bacterium]
MYFYILLAGFFGGVIRGLIGFLKHKFSYKNVPFNLTDFLGTVFISGIIGLMTAAVLREIGFTFEGFFTPALSFIAGYAGSDFLENIYKIIIKKSSIYKE